MATRRSGTDGKAQGCPKAPQPVEGDRSGFVRSARKCPETRRSNRSTRPWRPDVLHVRSLPVLLEILSRSLRGLERLYSKIRTSAAGRTVPGAQDASSVHQGETGSRSRRGKDHLLRTMPTKCPKEIPAAQGRTTFRASRPEKETVTPKQRRARVSISRGATGRAALMRAGLLGPSSSLARPPPAGASSLDAARRRQPVHQGDRGRFGATL